MPNILGALLTVTGETGTGGTAATVDIPSLTTYAEQAATAAGAVLVAGGIIVGMFFVYRVIKRALGGSK